MSSSSYLGHGAKYWAEQYFELQTQTRMPDDSSAIEWREKYLNLEKSCSLYQAKIADLRTEVEDLRSNANSETVLSGGRDAVYWHSEYLKAEDEIIRKEKVLQGALQKNLDLVSVIRNPPDCIYYGHDAKYWYSQLQSEKDARLASQATIANLHKDLDTRNSSSLFNGHTAEYWYNFCQKNHAADKELISNLEKNVDTLTTNSFREGHDIEYWYSKAIRPTRSTDKRTLFIAKSILLAFFLFIIFMLGIFLGEGYFIPHFTPSSPYIDSLNKSISSSYNRGATEGFSEGYSSGKKNGYMQGYSDGISGRPSDPWRWNVGDMKTKRDFYTGLQHKK